MNDYTTFVGMDVHKKNIVVALKIKAQKGYVEFEVQNNEKGIKKLERKIRKVSQGEVLCCYEAGPCGFALQRQLKAKSLECQVIAPSLIPVKAGDRIKTDKRDARKLANLLEADMLTEVHSPTEDEESLRDLCRCIEDAKQDLTRSRHRLSKWLLRKGYYYSGTKKNWTQAHRRWLKSLVIDREADRTVFGDYLLAIEQLEERVASLLLTLEAWALKEPYKDPVGWLRCFRGIETLTAMTILCELYDFRRFKSPKELSSYLGLVPSEYSSGECVRRGSITKTGNGHLRRVLIEASWHYRHKPAVGVTMKKRRLGQPPWAIAMADKAQHRLNRRFFHLVLGKNKPANKAVVALARELIGFIWTLIYPNWSKETTTNN